MCGVLAGRKDTKGVTPPDCLEREVVSTSSSILLHTSTGTFECRPGIQTRGFSREYQPTYFLKEQQVVSGLGH